MNLVVLSGRIYNLKRLGAKANVLKFSIRTISPVKTKDENFNEKTEFVKQYFTAISFDNYGRYGSVKDGDEVVVKGRLDVNIWENKEGTKVYETRIIVEDIMTADVLYEKQNKSRSTEGSGDSSSWVKTEGTATKQVAPVIEPSLSEYENEELPF